MRKFSSFPCSAYPKGHKWERGRTPPRRSAGAIKFRLGLMPEAATPPSKAERYPLRGTTMDDRHSTEPVAVEDWGLNKSVGDLLQII